MSLYNNTEPRQKENGLNNHLPLATKVILFYVVCATLFDFLPFFFTEYLADPSLYSVNGAVRVVSVFVSILFIAIFLFYDRIYLVLSLFALSIVGIVGAVMLTEVVSGNVTHLEYNILWFINGLQIAPHRFVYTMTSNAMTVKVVLIVQALALSLLFGHLTFASWGRQKAN